MEHEQRVNDRPDNAPVHAYPGSIHFNVTLQLSPDAERFILHRATKSHSCRLARKFGSASFIRVSCNKTADEGVDQLIEFCLSTFRLHNRIFDAIYHKVRPKIPTHPLCCPLITYQDSTIYLFSRGKHTSLEKLIRFINPIEENANQVCKFHVDRRVLKLLNRKPPNGFLDSLWGFLHLNPRSPLRRRISMSSLMSVCP
jgi:hypothetical protein